MVEGSTSPLTHTWLIGSEVLPCPHLLVIIERVKERYSLPSPYPVILIYYYHPLTAKYIRMSIFLVTMVAESIHFHGGWLLEVKCKKEEECVDCWKSKWREWECSLWKSQWKESECWKMRVFIDNLCHVVGSKNAGQNWSCGRSCEY